MQTIFLGNFRLTFSFFLNISFTRKFALGFNTTSEWNATNKQSISQPDKSCGSKSMH